MLRKRTRSIQRDQQMVGIPSEGGGSLSDFSGQRQKTNSFFNVPGLFVGLSTQCVSDCDSVRSPTSPLDFKLFSNLGNSIRFLKASQYEHQKNWGCNKVGLGSIVDSLDDDGNDGNLPEKSVISSCTNKTIIFGPQVRSKVPNSESDHVLFCEAPKSLPKNFEVFPDEKTGASNLKKGSSDVLFENGENPLEFDPYPKIQSFSLDFKRLGLDSLWQRALPNSSTRTKETCLECENNQGALVFSLVGGSPHAENNLTSSQTPIASSSAFAPALSPGEIELSEDYTCVISHGPNPRATHIFGDCVLGCHPIGIDYENKKASLKIGLPSSEKSLEISPRSPYPLHDFLAYCCFCNEKLEEGTDIYMYRGEKAFCSSECRSEGISLEEEKEKSIGKALGETSDTGNGVESFVKGMFDAI